MKRSLAPLALLAAASAASGCVQNELSLTIVGFSAISAAAGVCSGSPQSTTFVSLGAYDVGVPVAFGYFAAPVVQNNTITGGTTATVERNAVNLQGFEIELHTEGGGNFPSGLSNPFKTTIGQATATPSGGRQAVIVETFPRSVAVKLGTLIGSKWDGKLIVKMRPFGDIGGSAITGGWAELPIVLCIGCLTNGPIMPCLPGGFPTASLHTGNACYPAQDVPISCCILGNDIKCGNEAPTSTGGGVDAGL